MTPFTPSPELIEKASRKIHPELWAKIDAEIADDDWNGATALNARDSARRETRAAIAVIAPMLGEEAAKVANRHYTGSAAAIALRAHFGVPAELSAKSGSGE